MLPARSDVPSSGRPISHGEADLRAVRIGARCVLTAAVAVLIGAHVRLGADAREAVAEGLAVSAELDVAAHLQRDCGEHQLRLAAEVAAGRVALAEAADDVLDAGRARPHWLHGLAQTYPDDPDDRVRVARVLVTWVGELTADDPARHDEAVGRVTAEFEEMADAADD